MKHYASVRLNLWLPVLILASFMTMMMASSIWQYGEQTARLETRTIELIQYRMADMQHRLESLLRSNMAGLVAEEIAQLGSQPEVEFLALIDDSGQVMFSTQKNWLGKPITDRVSGFDPNRYNNALQKRQLSVQFDAQHDYILAYQPITLSTVTGQIRPTRVAVLLLGYNLVAEKNEIRQKTFSRSISDITIGGLTMVLLIYVLHRWLTLPLGYFRDAVNRISHGDFASRIEISGRGEMADLANAINKMQADLANSTNQLLVSNQELRASEENLAVTLNSIGDAVITTDTAGRVTHLNPVAEKLTGWPLADALGQPLSTVFLIINSQNRLPVPNPVYRVFETGKIVGLANHTSLISRQGVEHQIADSAAPILDKAGTITGVVLVFHDVSEQYRQQARIAASEAELSKITRILPGPVTRVDREGRYVFVSDVYQTWFGKRPEDVIGLTQREALGDVIYAQFEFQVNRAWAGESSSFEVTLPDLANNGQRHALVQIIPDMAADGVVCGYYTIGVDITQRKQAEQEALALRDQLFQATKMEAVGHLTAGIAHDFNNMLGAIIGYTELTQHVIAAGTPQTSGPYLAAVLKAANRAKELIAQMLTFSRKSSMATDDVPVILLTPIIKEVASLLRSSIPSSIDLNYRITTDNLKARIQAVHLHQIIINLGINARDAMGDYGKIDIILSDYHNRDEPCASCKHPIHGDYVQITVKDTGSGISPEVLDKIFDPFFTTKGVGQGTGMGLSVVHGLVHSLGGHIRVTTDNTGTAISILLPRVAAQQTEESAQSFSLPKSQDLLQGANILVVDDEPTMTSMLSDLLALHGAQVSPFNDPHEALASFRFNPQAVDLVITDETMPGLTGMHMAEQMLHIRPTLPIILCTGFSERANAETAAAMGIGGFFYKPVRMHDLLQKAQEMLQARKT